VSGTRKCAFIEERPCNFATDEISMDFCKVCIDAWKAGGGAKAAAPKDDRSKEKLAQIDKLFQDGALEPDDYIRLRKSLTEEKPKNAPVEVAKVGRKGFHLLLVEKGMFSKKVRTFPAGWKLPPTITGKLVESLYSMCDSAEKASDVKLEVEDTKIACLARDGGSLALIVTDDDLDNYGQLVASVGASLVDADDWGELLRVAASGVG
jgi:hypothetical protein